ncbi:molybdopterin oxidoreductase [Shewanella halifaxensis HAW-EB4]|uniref:Molybdopterin oxidoreductase n=1 Tax=Shewanella halifaxensis (strain HAW-EB4) TaxID=458817 RepID=B0TKH4_SHEHH|nr:molybdopterin-dependent oxidoreductase [Shewanella halifaxensis]ABZ78560.1 molybdopterin oxidoreductase [Shewanella halifaxensis HAW-EB4]
MKINRRTFMQGAGATAILSSLSGLTPGIANARTTGAHSNLLAKRNGEVVYHSCLRNCAARCLLKFRVQDGRMTYVSGAEEQAKTGKAPCLKGQAYVQYTYAPDRILHPMERVGAKGEGKWRRISWDEAYKKISDRLKSVITEHGSESILPYSYSGNYGAIGMSASGERFWNRIGSSILERKVCTYAAYDGLESVYGTFLGPDPEDVMLSDVYLNWGHDETVSNTIAIKLINKARDNGTKFLVVNPQRTPLCNQADVYLQPKPSTDVQLCAGIMKYLVEKDLVNHKFIQEQSIGYDDLLKRLDELSYDEIEQITGVPRAKMFEFAQILGENEKTMLRMGYGFQRNFNGARMSRAVAMLLGVTGNFGKRGNGLVYDNIHAGAGLNQSIASGKYMRKNKDAQRINMTEIAKAIHPTNPTSHDKPSKPIHAMIIYNGNPVVVAPDTNAVIEGMKREDLFVVGHDMVMTDSLQYCDIILPSASQFETDDIVGDYHGYYIQVCQKVIEPVGESKCNWTFFRELGQAMGFEDDVFKASNDDIIKELLDTDSPDYKGVTYERLMKEKFIKLDIPQPVLADGKYNTPSGKIEFSSKLMSDAGYHPVLDWQLPEEEMEPKERNLPFRLLSSGVPQRVNSSFYNVKYIRAIPAYYVKINPVDAKTYDVKDNDVVKLSNHRGEARFVVIVTEGVLPGSLMTPKCNWLRMNPNGTEGCTNSLTTDKLTDMGGCSAYHSTRVDLAKA